MRHGVIQSRRLDPPHNQRTLRKIIIQRVHLCHSDPLYPVLRVGLCGPGPSVIPYCGHICGMKDEVVSVREANPGLCITRGPAYHRDSSHVKLTQGSLCDLRHSHIQAPHKKSMPPLRNASSISLACRLLPPSLRWFVGILPAFHSLI